MQPLYSLCLLFAYHRPVWWDHQTLWKLPQLELSLVSYDEESGDSKWSYHFHYAAHWRTSVPTPTMGEIHLEQNKTWIQCLSQLLPYKGWVKSTILHGFGPLLQLLLPSPVWKRAHPEVPAHLPPRNQESHGRWTVDCSWRKTQHGHHGSLATAPSKSTT